MSTRQLAEQTAATALTNEVNRRLAPAVLANLQTNADQIALYLKKSNLAFTADNVIAAVSALHAQGKMLWEVDPVEVEPEPARVLTPREIETAAAESVWNHEAEENKRRQREKLDNDPAKFFERSKNIEAEKAAAAEAKAEELAADAINKSIEEFEVYKGPNMRDHARSVEIRKMLRTITLTKNGKKHNQSTLRAVRAVILRLPDDAKATDVPKIVEAINRDINAPSQRTKSWNGTVSHGGDIR